MKTKAETMKLKSTSKHLTNTTRRLKPTWLLSLLFLLAFCYPVGVDAQTGGGQSGGGSGGSGCQYPTRMSNVTALSDHKVRIHYELAGTWPQCSQNFEPYYIIFRRCSETPTVYEEIDRYKLPQTDCGQFWFDVDLRHTNGYYKVTFVLDEPGFPCGAFFDGHFELRDGQITFTLVTPTLYQPNEPVQGWCDPVPVCASCLPMSLDQDPMTAQGDTAVVCPIPAGPGETLSRSDDSGTSCTSCGTGDASGQTVPTIPLDFQYKFHLSGYQSSFGIGGMMPFDGSLHCAMVDGGDTLHVRFVDAMNGRVVMFTDTGGGVLKDEHGLYEEAKLVGGASLSSASHIEITSFTGQVQKFELFDFVGDDDPVRDREGRLVSIKNNRDFEYTLTYSDPKDFIIDKLTDPHGQQYTFNYNGSQGGRPAVESIVLPNGSTATFGYTNHMLTSVEIGGGGGSPAWKWENQITEENDAWAMTIKSPNSGEQVYRFSKDIKKADNGFQPFPLAALQSVRGPGGAEPITEILRDPNDDDRFVLVSGDGTTPGAGGAVFDIKQGIYYRRAVSWTYDSNQSNPWDAYDISWPTNYPENMWYPNIGGPFSSSHTPSVDWSLASLGAGMASLSMVTAPSKPVYSIPKSELIKGAPHARRTEYGEVIDLEYDADYFLTKRIYDKDTPDETFEEFTRNSEKQVTRYRDRLGRVTLFTYSNGNLVQREVGLTDNGSSDVQTAEYAVYDYVYSGNLMTAELSPLNTGQTDMYRTDYEYDASPNYGRIKKIKEAADTPGGTRPETTFVWNTDGEMTSSTDPMSRTVQYGYDELSRVISRTYNDTSTEQILYDDGFEASLVLATKDRNDVVTSREYDTRFRMTDQVVGAVVDSNLFDGYTPIVDPINQQISEFDYYTGTTVVKDQTVDGRKTSYEYDAMRRVEKVTRRPADGETLESISVYHDYNRYYDEDFMGRRTFYAYDIDGRLIRTVTETIPGGSGLPVIPTGSSVLTLGRDNNANAKYLIEDREYDVEGQLVKNIDPRSIETTYTYDSRGRQTDVYMADGTANETHSQTLYDLASNVTEVRSPRYFDATDTEGHNKSKVVYTYNGRELRDSTARTLDGSNVATSYTTYELDGRVQETTDPRNYDWKNFYHACCGRLLGRKDPLGHGSFSNTDYEGRVTHTASVEDYDLHTDSHDPLDAKTLSESTVRYDVLGRSVASTRWLSVRGNVDPNNVPIAGLDGLSQTLGLTSQVIYDSNLNDGVGLDHASGLTVDKLGGGTYQLSLSSLISKLSTDMSVSFGVGSAGSATVSINPEDEISVQIADGAGRSIMSAQLAPHDATVPFELISWSYASYNIETDPQDVTGLNLVVYGIGGSPFPLEERQSIDAIGAVTRTMTDGAGRTIVTIDSHLVGGSLDPSDIASIYQYDNQSNLLSARDPNEVGYDAVYNEHGWMTSRTDTYGDVTSQSHDHDGNVVSSTDAKSKSSTIVYDAAGRRKSVTDRLSGVTAYSYDVGSNLLSITDTENKVTSYAYDARGSKTTETYPDHVAMSNPGDTGYGIKAFAYDPLGRLLRATDQLGDTMTMNYDLAGRLTQRDYRLAVNSPSGTIADSDSFTHDDASRMLTATSGRYNNVVTNTYDDAGRLASEEISNNGRAYTTSRDYDDRSVLNKLTYHDNSVVDRVIDERGLLEELKLDSANIASWTFDDGGRRLQQTYSNGVVTDYSYRDDANGKDNLLASIDTTHPSGPTNQHVDDYDYTYDANKNKTSEVITGQLSGYGFNSGASPATYDDDDRLTGWNRTDGNKDQSWSLSLVGDWNSFTDETVTQNRTHNAVHELTAIDAQSLVYDVKGNITTNSNGQKYTYDFDNRMSEIDVDGNGTADLKFRYDALGRRVMYWNGTKWYDYVVAGQQLLMVYQTNGTAQHKFIFGSYVDEPVMIVRNLSSTPVEYFYHRNQQYSVVALTDASTGLTKERYAYDAYGNTIILNYLGTSAKSQSDFSNPFMYTGRFTHPTTGLYYFRARWYDPELGRFTSRDPLGYVDGMSLYRGYFAIDSLDPFGQNDWVWPWDPKASWRIQDTANLWSSKLIEGTIESQVQKRKFSPQMGSMIDLIKKDIDATIWELLPRGLIEHFLLCCDPDKGEFIGLNVGVDFATSFAKLSARSPLREGAGKFPRWTFMFFALAGQGNMHSMVLCKTKQVCFYPNMATGLGVNIPFGTSIDGQIGLIYGQGVFSPEQWSGNSNSVDISAGVYLPIPRVPGAVGGGVYTGGGQTNDGQATFVEGGIQMGWSPSKGGSFTTIDRFVDFTFPPFICIDVPNQIPNNEIRPNNLN